MATESPSNQPDLEKENGTFEVEEGLEALGLNDHEADVESPALNGGHEESFPANTSTLPTDYSDVPSNNSEDSGKQKQRRKYQRGGRKKGLQSVSESNLPEEDGADGYEPRGKSTRRTTSSKTKLKHRDSGSRPSFDTGIKAFNLKRAESSGGRPVGMSVEDRRSKSKAKPKLKHKAKSKRRKEKQQKEEEEERKENWESETSSEEEEEESASESESEEEEEKKGKKKKKSKKEEKKEEPKKPLSIRFDLNIELEIFLKAKIKGDITVTFLQ